MNYTLFLSLLLGYVAVLAVIGFVTARGGSNGTFFNANKNANWLLVSFGMIGASLSGVTFISVPGWTATSGLTYLPMVFGFLLGYLVIASLLEKLATGEVSEVVFALNTTMEGDTTNFYLYRKVKDFDLKLTTIARGIAVGDELEFADEVTLGRSIQHRIPYEQSLPK